MIADVVETDSQALDHRLAGHAVRSRATRSPTSKPTSPTPGRAPTADPAGVTRLRAPRSMAWVRGPGQAITIPPSMMIDCPVM